MPAVHGHHLISFYICCGVLTAANLPRDVLTTNYTYNRVIAESKNIRRLRGVDHRYHNWKKDMGLAFLCSKDRFLPREYVASISVFNIHHVLKNVY